jgi:hypothetical protein
LGIANVRAAEEEKMAAMIVKHRVANFEKWKTVFDEMEGERKAHGWTGYTILRDASDANLVVIVNRMADLNEAKRYGGSPVLKSAMEQAGVISPPEIQFLNDA